MNFDADVVAWSSCSIDNHVRLKKKTLSNLSLLLIVTNREF